jgi:ferric-dicitrate binding protein FerR (iron transport regulator)
VKPGERWLENAGEPGAQALRQALDEARGRPEQDAFARQRVWPRVQAPWWDRSGRVVSAAEHRGGWLPPLLAGAGIAIAAAVAVLVSGGWLRSGGPVVVADPDPRSAPSFQAIPSPPPAVPLTTGPGERTSRRLARGVDAELRPRTALLPGDLQTPPEVRVGRVRFSVPHQPPGQRYSVRAGAYRVVVLGTVFDVAVEEEGVTVEVTTGTVEVQEAATDRPLQRLSAGSSWSSRPNDPPPGAEPVRPDPVRRMIRPVRKPAARRAAQALEPASASADPGRDLARYRRIVEAGGPMAEVALYRIGEIQQWDLGDLRGAAATWERYRSRHPRGLARIEADLSLIDALVHLGESAHALEEARAFLDRYPRSERRAEIARVAGDLARKAGDCAAAVGFYGRALDSQPAAADEEDALFYRGHCLTSLQDARSAEALRAYLARYPLGRHAVQAQQLLRAPPADRAGGR